MQVKVLPYIGFSQQPDIFDRILFGRMGSQLDTGYGPLLGRQPAVELMQEVDHGPLSMIRGSIPDQQESFVRILALQMADKVLRIFRVARRIGCEDELPKKDIQGAVVGLSSLVVFDGEFHPFSLRTPHIPASIPPEEVTFI